MEKVQTFSKGMNSDSSPVYQPDGTYVDALNIEIIDDETQGSVAISNSKGNKFQITISNVGAISKVTYTTGGATNISINGQAGGGVTINSMKDLYNYILSDPAYTLLNVQYNVYYTDLTLLVYPKPGFTATVTVGAGITVNPTYVPAVNNLQCIGYGIIRDNIYLFTTANKTTDPQITGSGYGFIWKMTYNNINFDASEATISLIYGGDLSFSTYWNIPQTGVIGRYENSNIQRLYWTDNYNKLRSLNVADPQVGAFDISLVDVIPSSDFDIPILKDIRSAPGTASVDIGCYQMAYRLSNTGGASTCFSVPSNPVFVVAGYIATGTPGASEEFQNGGLFWEHYHGDILGTTTTKRITWTINNLDRDFNRLEAIVLFRDTKDGVPTIFSFLETTITDSSIDIVLDGDILNSDDTTIITLDEFLALNATFTHCKTIGTKDNRLVVGNIRNEQSDLDFDARAYRFNNTSIFKLVEDGSLSGPYTSASYGSIDEESDAICPANIEASDPGNFDAGFKYKANGTTIGGEGANISYEFVSVAVAMDKTIEPVNPQPVPNVVSTNPDYTDSKYDLNVFTTDRDGNDILQEYSTQFPLGINDGMKYPPMNGLFWGYQHNEVYRVGIQFYDKSKNPYFVKWIGDIKFPDYFDTCPAANNIYANGNQTGLTDYRNSFTELEAGVNPQGGANQVYSCQLGLKLEVNIDASLSDKISGYSVVRVKREESDKTILSEGIIANPFLNNGTLFYLGVGNLSYGAATANRNRISYITPNILDSSLNIPANGMKIRSSSALSPSNALQDINVIGGATASNDNKFLKLFDHYLTPAFECDIDFAYLQALNASTVVSGNTYRNYTYVLPDKIANGNPAYLLGLASNISNGVPSGDKYLAHIYSPIINQYGGNTYIDRGDNEYIICSHFRGIKSGIAYTDNSLIYGGDVTTDFMDEERISVDWTSYPGDHETTTFFYPASSPVNRELRHGRRPNTSQTDLNTSNNDRTDYFYNTVYSCQNDIVKFYPKPVPFTSNTVFDNRFYISEIKINGELTDSWSIYKANNYWDVEGDKGPINSMLSLKDKMYFWQDRAFGIIEINPRTLITDNGSSANSQVQTGTGLPLQRHDYLSTTIGTKHQGSTISSSDKLYWFDVNTKKIYEFGGQGVNPFSDVKGLYAYLSKNINGEVQNIDKPTYTDINYGINGVIATYDYKRHKAIFTFHSGINVSPEVYTQKSFTVVINELINAFTTFHSFTPRIYINDYKVIFSTDNSMANETGLNDCYLHDYGDYGMYYGVVYAAYIKFISNTNPVLTKIFDNLTWDSQSVQYIPGTNSYLNYNDDTWNSIRITNDYQNTDTQDLIVNSNIKRRERTWKLAIPRNRVLYTVSNSPNIYTDLSPTDKDFGERIRDKYMQVELTYDNTNNRELRTNNLTTIFRQSPR